MSLREDGEVSVSLSSKPDCVVTQQWAIYMTDNGPAVARFLGTDGRTYEDRSGSWFRIEYILAQCDN